MDLVKSLQEDPANVAKFLHLRGWNDEVMTQVFNQGGSAKMLHQGFQELTQFHVAKYRCRSGHHRSVALAEVMGDWMRRLSHGTPVRVVHMACHLDGELGSGEHYDFPTLWSRITTDPESLTDLRACADSICPLGLHLPIDNYGQNGLYPAQKQELMVIWGNFEPGIYEASDFDPEEEHRGDVLSVSDVEPNELFSSSAADPEGAHLDDALSRSAVDPVGSLSESVRNEDCPCPEPA